MGIMQNYTFPVLRKELLGLEIIDSKVGKKLDEWYRLRNRVIHRLLTYGYLNYEWNRVTRTEVNDGFDKGLYLADTFNKISLGISESVTGYSLSDSFKTQQSPKT